MYRPVTPRTNTETVHIVDPEVETTLTSSDGSLVVTLPAGARDEFFQTAIDALSNNCGTQAPVDERRMCLLVDLFDLAAESIEESLNLTATMSVILNSQQYNAAQTDIANDEFTIWKGHGASSSTWSEIPECKEPRGRSECFSLIQGANGGKITVFNITGFSEFAAGLVLPDPSPTPPPSTTPPTGGTGDGSGSGGSGSSTGSGSSGGRSSRARDDYEYQGNQTPQIFGDYIVTYQENGTEPVARYTARDPDDDEITWSLLGYDRREFEITDDGVLRFRSPPDYESPTGREDNTYWIIVQAEDDGRPSEYDVHNVRVTVTQVNELGQISGEGDVLVSENHAGTIAQYQIVDPEEGVITWSLSGPDASAFNIDEQGNLFPAISLDFETQISSAGDNTHVFTITATDDGAPEASAQLEVTLAISNVNEAPLVASIPGVQLTIRHLPWMIDLGEYFTDPDGDSLVYDVVGQAITDVARAHIESGTMSIEPVGEGMVSFFVVASDTGGLRAVGKVAVTVTDPAPAPTPVPAKVTIPAPTSTPAPAAVVDVVPTIARGPVAAIEPPPAHVPLVPLSERRWRNLTQQADKVSKVIVAFAVQPIDTPVPERIATLTPFLVSDPHSSPCGNRLEARQR